MRILFLTPETCPTFRADVNVLFGKYLPRHGIYSDIVAGRTPGHDGEVTWGGGGTFLCDVSRGQAEKHLKMLIHGIRHLLNADKARYQAIQVRDMPVLAFFGLIAARLKGLKFFYWMSYPMPEGQIELARERGLSAGLIKFLFPWLRGRVGRFLLYKIVLPRSDRIFVQTERMRDIMIDQGLAREKMAPVPMGVDMEEIGSSVIPPSNDSRLAGKRVLLYLGTLDRPRRLEILFEMIALVRQKIPNAVLVLVGDTEDDVCRRQLKAHAEKAGVADAVIWSGWLAMKDGWRYIRAAEVGLSPIPRGPLLDVGSPTKAIEYLAMGLPVLGNDNPDQAKIIRESGAGICVPYTAEDFASAVIDLLEADPRRLSQMGRMGNEYVSLHRNYNQIAQALAGHYQKTETQSGEHTGLPIAGHCQNDIKRPKTR